MNKLLIVALLAAVCVVAAVEDDAALRSSFESWKVQHGKTYFDDEHERRFAVFKSNMALAELYNSQDAGATYGASAYADLTQDEFRAMYLAKEFLPEEGRPAWQMDDIDVGSLPSGFDWREKGAVTAVKNQGQCGSCWAFSTTGNIEGVSFLATGALPDLSEQQLVDCDKVDQGCNGGLPSNAYQYIIKNGGIDTESSYPYMGFGQNCQYKASDIGAKISNWTAISTDEDQIAAQLMQHGPLSIGINAGWMQLYIGGISDPLICNPKKLDHGVLIVGFGTKGSKPYWIIKNSWGPSWGEKGYYLIIRGKGKCGLNRMVTTSIH